MRTVYLENNAINRALEAGLSGKVLRVLLERQGMIPVIGITTVVETARELLEPTDPSHCLEKCQILADLCPRIAEQGYRLLQKELAAHRTGVSVSPFVSAPERKSIQKEINEYTHGHMSLARQTYILQRYTRATEGQRGFWENVIEKVREDKECDPILFRVIRSLCQFENWIRPEFPTAARRILENMGELVTETEATEMVNTLDNYPALRTVIRANVLLKYHAQKNLQPPARNRIWDYHHLAEGSYCNVFVTDDSKLIDHAGYIHPQLQVRRFGEVIC